MFGLGHHTDPANVPLPPTNEYGTPPPSGRAGSYNDAIGDTHAAYGNHPVSANPLAAGGLGLGGLPKHASHLEYNYNKHPMNNDFFPVNNAGGPANQRLRDNLIANKPKEDGMSRDHKPPNVQNIPGTAQQRHDRTTVQNLPSHESKGEMRLLGMAKSNANRQGASGMIHLSPNIDESRSRASSQASIHSLPPDQRQSRLPQPKSHLPQIPAALGSPRRLRSGATVGGGAPQPQTPARGTSGLRQPGFSGARPASSFNAPRPSTPGPPTPAPRQGSRPPPRGGAGWASGAGRSGGLSSAMGQLSLGGKKKGGKRDLGALIHEVLKRRAMEYYF